MLYEVSFQSKKDAEDPNSNFRSTLYVESEDTPDLNEIRKLVEKHTQYTEDDFAPDTIQIEECPNIDVEKFRKQTKVIKLN